NETASQARKCGMRNAECGMAESSTNSLAAHSGKFRIPHYSPFRIPHLTGGSLSQKRLNTVDQSLRVPSLSLRTREPIFLVRHHVQRRIRRPDHHHLCAPALEDRLGLASDREHYRRFLEAGGAGSAAGGMARVKRDPASRERMAGIDRRWAANLEEQIASLPP